MQKKYDPRGANINWLEIGAGERPQYGYIHQDIRPLDDIEIVCDLRELDQYVMPGWKLVRAAHILEHFTRDESLNIMKMIHNLLDQDGVFQIDVPNLTWQTMAHAFKEITDDEAVYFIYGKQDYLENTHKNGYTIETLTRDLNESGFNCTIQDIGQVLVASAFKRN